MLEFKKISEFNRYLGIKETKSDLINIGIYGKSDNLRSKSEEVRLSFYRVSIKLGMKGSTDFGKTKFDEGNSYVFFLGIGKPISWDQKDYTFENGYYINLSEELVEEYSYLKYNFMDYGAHEALILTKEEEGLILNLFKDMKKEYDKENFSQSILLAYSNLLFTYINEFYLRQFGTRKELNNKIVREFLELLDSYYLKERDEITEAPTVKYFAEKLVVSPTYLSDLLRELTGKSALDHIHNEIIKKAKYKLVNSTENISEIAYGLGYNYPTYFSRLFKKITGKSPSNFRKDKNRD